MLARYLPSLRKPTIWILAAAVMLTLALLIAAQGVLAGPSNVPQTQVSPLHPSFVMLDGASDPVIETGQPVSTLNTCGACHDTNFISQHSYHASVGLYEGTEPGQTGSGRLWDTSPGYFGRWNPITYRTLTPQGDERLDLGTAEWIMTLGLRHVGGGPATTGRDGTPLDQIPVVSGDPETHILDPETGEAVAWDWSESGVVEMNCFLCHTPQPNNESRTEALQSGRFEWANTATLVGSGIVAKSGDTYSYNLAAFTPEGELEEGYVIIQDPTNENCGLCHGLVHDNVLEPIVLTSCKPEAWRTETTGQIISGQRLSDTGMNLASKQDLNRSWDIHAERLLECTDCHFSLNNPVYYQTLSGVQPEHLTFDPRRLEIGEYLLQPLHQFARGSSAQSLVAPEMKDTMRRCESCHDADNGHEWLPYLDVHIEAVSCESCHIPKIYSSTFRQYDWTVVSQTGQALTACRGVEDEHSSIDTLITGYEPVLLPRQDVDGQVKLSPHNLITSWFWVYGDPERPVPLNDLQSVYLDGEDYHPEILAAFDSDGDESLSEAELVIDTSAKEALVASRLADLGLANPRIEAEIQPYSINHTVAAGEWATRDCASCHGEDSRITAPIELSSRLPGGVLPEFVADSNTLISGELYTTDTGELYYRPETGSELYVLGHNSVWWIDLFGSLAFVGVLLGITVHGGLRFWASLRRPPQEEQLQRVYMYSLYERLWHWLQTFTIVLLLLTGLIIHKPDTFGIFSFRGVVAVHNVMAAILVINAGLSLFYHLASGEIKQYIPRPRGFFDQAILQTIFYLRGIFRNEPHPFEKTPDRKLNPLQQITYFAILNLLLPLQVITGALMWGAQRWPSIAGYLGGLLFLAPFHTLIAWLFASFIVMHVYLTTTGHAPLAGIRSMIMGWDELEIQHPSEEAYEA
jgi:thiosulfate reductase cytochrome b subunit/cytochrome c553